MHGNVWEWCEDVWHVSYDEKPEALKANGGAWTTGDSSLHVVRGGSWVNDPRDLRSAYRDRDGAGGRGDDRRLPCCQNAHLLNLYIFTSFALFVGWGPGA